MKNILFISYYFPPLGGGGVQRSLKFIKYLPGFGWNPIVITSKGLINNTKDNSLLKEIPINIEIIYLPSYSILNLKKKIKNIILNKIINFLYYLHIPDGLFFWYFFNKKKIFKIIQDKNIDTIYSTSPPNSSHLFGLYFKKKNKNLKWIADFRDEWATNPEKKFEKNILKNNIIKNLFDNYYEKKTIKIADKIILVSPNIKNKFEKSYKLSNKFKLITNGYDEEDFKNIKKYSSGFKLTFIFKILYFGSLYGSRNPYIFLKAFKEFYKKINDKNEVKIDFIGNIDKKNKLEKYLKENKLNNNIFLIDYIENKNLFSKINEYDLLLLFISKYHGDVIPGKLYEYFRLNTPILALSPINSITANLIKKTKTGVNADCEDVKIIKNELFKFYSKWKNNILQKEYIKNKNWKNIEQFERKKLTEQLSNILDSL